MADRPKRRTRITVDLSDADAPMFVISVAAELSGMHPQTLRSYDRMGIVSPGRATGGGRRYSQRDIELLRAVAELTASGIGIEGVRRILELEHQVAALQARIARARGRPARSRPRHVGQPPRDPARRDHDALDPWPVPRPARMTRSTCMTRLT